MSINLHLGDCLEAMRAMPDNAYELAIVDPPYGIGAGSNSFKNGTSKNKTIGFRENDWDKERPSSGYFEELVRVSCNQIIWGGNYFADLLEPKMCWLFWDKGTGDNSYADGELAWTSFDKAVRKFKKSWVGANANNGTPRIHPTEKPVKLYEWLLDNYAKEGDRILDTHLGSGSIAFACHNRGYSLDAYEIDKEYYNAAKERLRAHQSQLTIF